MGCPVKTVVHADLFFPIQQPFLEYLLYPRHSAKVSCWRVKKKKYETWSLYTKEFTNAWGDTNMDPISYNARHAVLTTKPGMNTAALGQSGDLGFRKKLWYKYWKLLFLSSTFLDVQSIRLGTFGETEINREWSLSTTTYLTNTSWASILCQAPTRILWNYRWLSILFIFKAHHAFFFL